MSEAREIHINGDVISWAGRDIGTVNVNKPSNHTSNQTLVEAAKEIQQLLDQLSQDYPTTTRAEQLTVAAKAVEQIEGNSNLTERVLRAFKAGSVSALEELLNHPAASFVIAALKDWQDSRENLS